MHEVSLMIQAMKIVFATAEEHGVETIRRVTLVVGEMTGAMPDALTAAFEAVTAGTCAEKAELQIQRVKPTAKCDPCDIIFPIDHFNRCCPHCGKFGAIETGTELYVDSIEGD